MRYCRGQRPATIEVVNGPLEIDHVLIAVANLIQAAAEFERRYGLASVDGGRHDAWGTANRIVPLGDSYLELITVIEPERAARTSVARWVMNAPVSRPMGWAVRTADIDGIAARLGLKPTDGSRTTPDGRNLRWRSAGIDEASADPALPFFIEWGADVPHPGATDVAHAAGPVRLGRVVVRGEAARLASWLGSGDLPVEVQPGPSGVLSIELSAPGGDFVLP
jgi:hypothetical protein